jgi:hypothetical protein
MHRSFDDENMSPQDDSFGKASFKISGRKS